MPLYGKCPTEAETTGAALGDEAVSQTGEEVGRRVRQAQRGRTGPLMVPVRPRCA